MVEGAEDEESAGCVDLLEVTQELVATLGAADSASSQLEARQATPSPANCVFTPTWNLTDLY